MGTAARPGKAKDTVSWDVNRPEKCNEAARWSVCSQIITRNYLMHWQTSIASKPPERRQCSCRRLPSKDCNAPSKCLTASNHINYLTWMTDIMTVCNKLLMCVTMKFLWSFIFFRRTRIAETHHALGTRAYAMGVIYGKMYGTIVHTPLVLLQK